MKCQHNLVDDLYLEDVGNVSRLEFEENAEKVDAERKIEYRYFPHVNRMDAFSQLRTRSCFQYGEHLYAHLFRTRSVI